MDLKLKDKLVLITGASKGIGAECLKVFQEEGARTIAVARDISVFEKSENLIPFEADISNSGDLENLIFLLKNSFSQIDILVNNVGMNIRKSSLDYNTEDWDHIFNTNLKGAYKLALALFENSKNLNASIVNVSSVASIANVATSTLEYSMTKAALNQMTKFMANKWAERGIRVNAVLPWYIETPLVKSVLEDPDKKRLILDQTPMNRVGQVREVADTIAFLASEKASYITGSLIPIDGGYLCRS